MTRPPTTNPPTPSLTPLPGTPLGRLDAWMNANPWHPRATPFFVYVILIMLGGFLTDGPFGLPELTALKPAVYTVQVALVLFLLWRYRRLLPELNVRFHWLAVPTGVGLLFAWVYLGYLSIWLSRELQGVPLAGDLLNFFIDPTLPISPQEANHLAATGQAKDNWILDHQSTYGQPWFWLTMSLRLLGMSLVVPLFEELWVRSAVLRGCLNPKQTWTALLQLAQDLPIIGEMVEQTQAGQRAAAQPPMFTEQLRSTAVGQVSLFAVVVSTFVFMLSHQQRDYLGCIACGIVWCWLVWVTNKPGKGETWADQPVGGRMGLGPIVWSHGITNATLWAWTLYTGDWQFL